MTEFRDAVRRGYDALGAAYREQRTTDEPGFRPFLERFADRLDDGARVLDAGCGPGTVTARLAERSDVVGLDISRSQLDLAREHIPGAALAQGDMAALPFDDAAFDGLVALYSVIHVPRGEHAAVFEEFRRVLRPGAPALLTIGDGAWEGTNPDWLDAGVEMRWSFHGPERTTDALRDAGFAILETGAVDDDLGDGQFVFVLARADESSPWAARTSR